MAASTSSLLYAEFRRGLKDLQNAVLDPLPNPTATHEDFGTIGNPTPQAVTRNIDGKSEFQSMVNDYAAKSVPVQEAQLER